jgi:hypothetical protein
MKKGKGEIKISAGRKWDVLLIRPKSRTCPFSVPAKKQNVPFLSPVVSRSSSAWKLNRLNKSIEFRKLDRYIAAIADRRVAV